MRGLRPDHVAYTKGDGFGVELRVLNLHRSIRSNEIQSWIHWKTLRNILLPDEELTIERRMAKIEGTTDLRWSWMASPIMDMSFQKKLRSCWWIFVQRQILLKAPIELTQILCSLVQKYQKDKQPISVPISTIQKPPRNIFFFKYIHLYWKKIIDNTMLCYSFNTHNKVNQLSYLSSSNHH